MKTQRRSAGAQATAPVLGPTIFARLDGKHLTVREVEALLLYAQVELVDMRLIPRTHYSDRAAAAQRIAETRINPEAFAELPRETARLLSC
ncbi:hypothetical protein LTR85_011372 [Meristemomyces frigidus]|nr:hypothetical protein LTR85_011372 [Meristemomyces frigidus]